VLDRVRRSPDTAVFVGSHRSAEAVLASAEQYEALQEAKLGPRDRIQAVVYAYENGLIARNPMTSTISQEEQPKPTRPDSRGD
jgi:hypothetical protein